MSSVQPTHGPENDDVRPEERDPSEPRRNGAIDHERGIPSVNRIRSMQSRVTGVLAMSFASVMALGFLAWYYTHEWQKAHVARTRAESTTQQRLQGETKLPPLGRIQPSFVKPATSPPNTTSSPPSTLWGPAPPAPPGAPSTIPAAPMAYRPQAASANREAAVDRRLTGPVLSGDNSNGNAQWTAAPQSIDAHRDDVGAAAAVAAPGAAAPNSADSLAGLLKPTLTPASFARVLPTQRLLLPEGWKIDCTLETAIDSSLRGLVTCVTPVDIFGADGSTVLLPRGTELTGETRGEVRQGLARVFVLWTEARTPPPDGVVALLDSPGTDELGRSGLPGQVQRHFFERFGAAILVSVIEGAIQRATQPSEGRTVILNPATTSSVATEVLKSTVNIPPTILKNNGDRIQILVARDVDFRSVYELRPVTATR